MSGPLASSGFSNSGITGLTSFQTMVYSIIQVQITSSLTLKHINQTDLILQATLVETGIEKSQIYSAVKGKMASRDVEYVLDHFEL